MRLERKIEGVIRNANTEEREFYTVNSPRVSVYIYMFLCNALCPLLKQRASLWSVLVCSPGRNINMLCTVKISTR